MANLLRDNELRSLRLHFAGCPQERERLLRLGIDIEAYGHQVVSRWLLGWGRYASPRTIAQGDLTDLVFADMLIVFCDEEACEHSGHHDRQSVAFGYALHVGMSIVVVGDRENPFQHLGNVTVVPDRVTLDAQLREGMAWRLHRARRPWQWLSPEKNPRVRDKKARK